MDYGNEHERRDVFRTRYSPKQTGQGRQSDYKPFFMPGIDAMWYIRPVSLL
jgi:hypothetical protein